MPFSRSKRNALRELALSSQTSRACAHHGELHSSGFVLKVTEFAKSSTALCNAVAHVSTRCDFGRQPNFQQLVKLTGVKRTMKHETSEWTSFHLRHFGVHAVLRGNRLSWLLLCGVVTAAIRRRRPARSTWFPEVLNRNLKYFSSD